MFAALYYYVYYYYYHYYYHYYDHYHHHHYYYRVNSCITLYCLPPFLDLLIQVLLAALVLPCFIALLSLCSLSLSLSYFLNKAFCFNKHHLLSPSHFTMSHFPSLC